MALAMECSVVKSMSVSIDHSSSLIKLMEDALRFATSSILKPSFNLLSRILSPRSFMIVCVFKELFTVAQMFLPHHSVQAC